MYRVLIVDDEPLILEGLKHVIDWEQYGLQIAGEASDGRKAFDLLSEVKFDVLITDIKMPEMDGVELIRKIREGNLNIKCIVLSGYDDFNYVKEVAKLGIENYILKPVDNTELTTTLINTIEKIEAELYRKIEYRMNENVLRDNILNRWALGEIDEDEFKEKNLILEVPLENKSYLASIIKTVNLDNGHIKEKFQDLNLLRFSINNICALTISETDIKSVSFPNINGDIAIVFFDEDIIKIKDILKNCIDNVQQYLNVEVFASVGTVVKSFDNFHLSYKKAVSIQEYKIIMQSKQLLLYDDINEKFDLGKNSKIELNIIANSIETMSREQIRESINSIFSIVKNNEAVTVQAAYNLAIEILFMARSVISKKGIPQESITTNDIHFSELFNINSLDELVDKITEFVFKYVELLKEEDDKRSPVIRKIAAYINENYMNEISIKTLAASFNINPNYLGQLFRDEMQVPLNTYLNNIRTEKAKELLLNTNLKAWEISAKVGYLNPNYFYTIFKKQVGCSPIEFKEKSNA